MSEQRYKFTMRDAEDKVLHEDVCSARSTIIENSRILGIVGDAYIHSSTLEKIYEHLMYTHGGVEWLVLQVPEGCKLVEFRLVGED